MAKSRKKAGGGAPSQPDNPPAEASSPQGSTTAALDTPPAAMDTAPQSVGDTTAAGPDRERIAMRAYEIYRARGGTDGLALDDWLTAEREVLGGEGRSRETE